MSHKTSAARRAAFFKALRETGNQTLACERAKVSRSWMELQRATHPQFRADVIAAVEDARQHFDPSTGSGQAGWDGTRRPSSGWGHLDGEELVVKGTGGSGGGKRVQIARARLKQWTPRVEARFLQALMATCNVKAACAEVGMSAAGAYAHRKRWPRFASLWDEAIAEGYKRIEIALLENGLNLFSELELPPETPLRGMDVAQAIRLLHMHKHGVMGLGKAPGVRWRAPPSLHEVRPGILRKLGAWQAARDLPPEMRAADARAYARRRGGGPGRESSRPAEPPHPNPLPRGRGGREESGSAASGGDGEGKLILVRLGFYRCGRSLIEDRLSNSLPARAGGEEAGDEDDGAQAEISGDHRDRIEDQRRGEGDPEEDRVEPEILAQRLADAEKGVVAGDQGLLGGGLHHLTPWQSGPTGAAWMPFLQHGACQNQDIVGFQYVGLIVARRPRRQHGGTGQMLAKAANMMSDSEQPGRRGMC